MKQRIATLILAGAFLAACEAPQDSGDDTAAEDASAEAGLTLDTDAQKRSYALGMDIGNSIKDLPVELKVDYLTAGLGDTLQGEAKIPEKEFQKVMEDFVADLESAEKEKSQAKAEANLEKGQAFLEENKGKEGVKVTDSGLQYKVVEAGEGPSPGPADSVKVHYEGTLLDGTVFASSRERGEPVTFPVKAVIPGWTEALQLMKEGARYKLFIPPDLAYGERGAGADIGPNETLIFDVELLEVIPEEQAGGGEDG